MNSKVVDIIYNLQQVTLPRLHEHFRVVLGQDVSIVVHWDSLTNATEQTLLNLSDYLKKMQVVLDYAAMEKYDCKDLKSIIVQHLADNSKTQVMLQKGKLHCWANFDDVEGIPSNSELMQALKIQNK